jgi:type I restriction enzyme S subunit
MSEWRESTWGNEISLEYGKSLRDYADATGPYRVFGSNGPVGWTSEPLAQGPGVILGRKGAYRGVRFSRDPFFVIDTAYYVVPKSQLDMRWLYYAIVHYKLGEIDDGSPIPSTTRAAVYVRDLLVPTPEEQRGISAILGALDDRIELNQRMNETLKRMARAIFEDWFVHFGPTRAKQEGRPPYLASEIWARLPDRLNDYGIPEGWKMEPLVELTSKIGSGSTPTGGSQVYVTAGTALIRSQNVYDDEFAWEGLARITDGDANKLSGVTVLDGDILINITGDSILRCCVVDAAVLPARVNQHVSIVRAKPHIPNRFIQQYLVLRRTKEILLGFDAGGSRAAVTKAHLERLPVLLPNPQALAAFETVTAELFAREEANRRECQTLSDLRDLLLPKLMSGEIRLLDAEKMVRGAV